MENSAYRLLYDNVHDFKAAAVSVEAEIKRLGIRYDRGEIVPGTEGRTHHQMWVSMKTVSHFNLGTALELMLKLLLVINEVPLENFRDREGHLLTKLYNSIPKAHRYLESIYRESRRGHVEGFELLMFVNTAQQMAELKPEWRSDKISCLSGFFDYLDQDVIHWKKRYSWEPRAQSRWRHCLGDISVPAEFIERVMRDIPRERVA